LARAEKSTTSDPVHALRVEDRQAGNGKPLRAQLRLADVIAHNLRGASERNATGPLVFAMRWRIMADVLRAATQRSSRQPAHTLATPEHRPQAAAEVSTPGVDAAMPQIIAVQRHSANDARWESRGVSQPQLAVDVPGFAEFWGESERTVYRALAVFRRAFPGEADPNRVLDCCHVWDDSLGWRGLAESEVFVSVGARPSAPVGGRAPAHDVSMGR